MLSTNMADSLDYKLGVIDTKLDTILDSLIHVDKRQDRGERRITILENARWKLVGIVAGASAVISLLMAVYFKK